MQEILWYGRGGQGVVLAAQVLAEAAYKQGYGGVTSAPTFGPERRGAPLTASTKISKNPIRTVSQIGKADIAVVLDESLFEAMNIAGRLKKGGIIIVNTASPTLAINTNGAAAVACVDAAVIAREERLSIRGIPIINTPMLGAVVKASGIVTLDSVEKGLAAKMTSEKARANYAATEAAYRRTTIEKRN